VPIFFRVKKTTKKREEVKMATRLYKASKVIDAIVDIASENGEVSEKELYFAIEVASVLCGEPHRKIFSRELVDMIVKDAVKELTQEYNVKVTL
jgi:tellurite resistance protein